MECEIFAQPDVLGNLLADTDRQIAAVATAVRRRNPDMVVLVARGSSDHAALYLKYLIEVKLGLPVGLSSPSSTTLYGANPWGPSTLVLALSQSGGSPDLVASLASARTAGALTLALTNAPSSDLAAVAELHVDVHAGVERSVAATKSYTAELAGAYALVRAWEGHAGASSREVAGAVRDAALAALETRGAVTECAHDLRDVRQLVVTGRGFAYATARESALKFMETCYLPALAFSAADLLHGPFALLGPDVPAVVLVPAGRASVTMADVLERIVATGAPTVSVGAGPRPVGVRLHVQTEHDLPEDVAPIVDVIPLQLMALELARARGLDADTPRSLVKVTKTL